MPMMKALIALTALFGAPGGPQPDKIAIEPPAAPRLSADAVVGKVQAFYLTTQSLKAKFRQEYTNTTFGKTSTSDGVVWIKKPGKMRWDYHKRKKVVKSFISDGQLLWAVEHDNKQVFKKNLGDDVLPVAITFLYGKGDLAKDFDAALDPGKYGKAGDYVLKLTPKQVSAQYKTLWLVVDAGNYRVRESIVLESSGNTNHFRFFEPDTASTVKDAWFTFNPGAFPQYKLNVIKPQAQPAAPQP